jgi:hypothetical protein
MLALLSADLLFTFFYRGVTSGRLRQRNKKSAMLAQRLF